MDYKGNGLVGFFGALAIGLIVFIGFKSAYKGHSQPATQLKAVPQPDPTADSPNDTIRALVEQVKASNDLSNQLRKDNEALLQQKNDLRTEITNHVRDEMTKNNQDTNNGAFSNIMQRVDSLSQRLDQSTSHALGDAGIAIGGTDGSFTVEPLNSGGLLKTIGTQVDALKDKAGNAFANGGKDEGSLLHGLGQNGIVQGHLPNQAGQVTIEPPEPVYTVPRNSTLVGSTGMTALIGRIPFKGHVEDPYPFKVIVGSDNLAANGLEIPGVDGMIFSGHAIGDWALSCVRGEIHSVTFVFEDGTIRTLSSDDQSLQQKTRQSQQAAGNQAASQTSGNSQRPLGWLSDRRGIPCLTGQRITNAPQYLGGRFLARAIGAAGEAYARSQTTIQSSPVFGGATSTVTGNPTEYALGSMASGSADELAEWIAERQAQNYDAVFVDTGAEVVLHIDQELPIDFEPNGRKLSYPRKKRHSHHLTHAKLD